jgi:hypothetical protein
MKTLLTVMLLWALNAGVATAADEQFPRYKPYSKAPAPVDIRTNRYGATRSAPLALGIGDTVPDFTLPRAGGGEGSLTEALRDGPVALIFYRGHW